MSSSRLVSVVVPTYNYGHFIGQTIECLQAQTYQNWECVVVDDGSTDNTREVVARYTGSDGRIKFFQQENQLQGAAKNTAIRNSAGTYFQFLDADDWIESKKLEKQLEYLEQHPEVDIVYGDARFFNAENPSERLYAMWGGDKPWVLGMSGEGRDVLKSLVRFNRIPIHTPLVRRSVIERVGFFDETLPPVEDWDYWIRCAAAGARFHFENYDDTLALVRSHPSSSSKNNRRLLASTLLMRKKLRALITGTEISRLNDELIAEGEGALGVEEVLHGNSAKGVYQLCKAAMMDKKIKRKVRWLGCALAVPFASKHQFRRISSSSITGSVRAALRQLKTSKRH